MSFIRHLALAAVAMLVAAPIAFAQSPNPQSTPDTVPVGGELLIPIISIAVVGYGMYKVRERR